MLAEAKGRVAKRTVSFFRLVVEDESGQAVRFPDRDWQRLLEKIRPWPLLDRTYEGSQRRLIAEVMDVDGAYALKLMEPRDENSWLEILNKEQAAAPVDIRQGELVETTIVAFLDDGNTFGIIRGSMSSPTHAAVAEWFDHVEVAGQRLTPNRNHVVRAEPALSRRQREKLNSSSGVSMASVRISTTKAQQLQDAGSGLATLIRSMRETYGDMTVTVTLRVPQGKAYDAARTELKRETLRLRSVSDDAEAVSATLVHYDAEEKAHREQVNFVQQRITATRSVDLLDANGELIRNASAVRSILSAAWEARAELSGE